MPSEDPAQTDDNRGPAPLAVVPSPPPAGCGMPHVSAGFQHGEPPRPCATPTSPVRHVKPLRGPRWPSVLNTCLQSRSRRELVRPLPRPATRDVPRVRGAPDPAQPADRRSSTRSKAQGHGGPRSNRGDPGRPGDTPAPWPAVAHPRYLPVEKPAARSHGRRAPRHPPTGPHAPVRLNPAPSPRPQLRRPHPCP